MTRVTPVKKTHKQVIPCVKMAQLFVALHVKGDNSENKDKFGSNF